MPRADVALTRPLAPPTGASRFGARLRRPGTPIQIAALVVAGLLVWRLADVLLLAFGAILVAVLLHALSEPLTRRLRLPRPLALTIAVAGFATVIGGAIWLFGQQIGLQLTTLGELLPKAWTALQAPLSASPLGAYILDDLQNLRLADGLVVQTASRLVRGSLSAAAATVIVLFCGLYLAFHPATYLRGLLHLVPPRRRDRVRVVLAACGEALNRWLLGALASMLLVGGSVGLGLWWAGVPSPLALGVLAGLAQFVPVIGPWAATVPGLIVAAAQGPQTFAWAVAIYLGSSQVEANVMTPLLLRQMVELPMGLTLFAVLAMGVLLGPLGVLFATPLAVVAYVVVRHLYVEDLLGDPMIPPANQGAAA
ncbi:AI-2E family transporter [uncultured Phenylobacterium sp.]|uniref:AI-2E family transporter n=1 Tax=uncultured Phenylobacterium sp. TaxID=349273 RepID=UPI0025E859B2|nr:AI-2E family transporter [uncultured Phenylobacterium sp.]